jgi:hypothetical protein
LTNVDDLVLAERKSGSLDGVVATSAVQLGDMPGASSGGARNEHNVPNPLDNANEVTVT